MSATNGSGPERSDARIVLYMSGVSVADIESVADRVADVAVEQGLVGFGETRALIAAEPWGPWPESPDELLAAVRENAAFIVIPEIAGAEDDEDDS